MSESAQDEPVLLDIDGGVARLTLNRPRQLNALDYAMAERLCACLERIEAEPSLRVVTLTGAGRAFMGGGDLSVFHRDLANAPEAAAGLIDLFHRALRMMQASPRIVIAGVRGAAAGGGLSLALACDLCVAAEDATFLSAYTAIGTSPDGGLTWTLTRQLGPRRALEAMLLNERIDAARAQALGLVNRVVPADRLEQEMAALAQRLAQGPAEAFARCKRLVQSALLGDLDAQLDLERAGFIGAAGTADFREGVAAFFERRPARFG